MPKTIAIALSGGIDSLMTAALLKDQGYQLIGIHFLTGYETVSFSDAFVSSEDTDFDLVAEQARQNLAPMVDQLDLPLHIVDLRKAFQHQVVDYFVGAYQSGLTPNPCLKCNPSIKFGLLYDAAERLGATHMATGHYARLETEASGHVRLLRGVDPVKDQSYFLARLSQSQLRRTVFPLGGYNKDH